MGPRPLCSSTSRRNNQATDTNLAEAGLVGVWWVAGDGFRGDLACVRSNGILARSLHSIPIHVGSVNQYLYM